MYANLIGARGKLVASVDLEQSYRGAMFQFERAYLRYQLRRSRNVRAQVARVNVSHFYRRCRQLGVPVRNAPA